MQFATVAMSIRRLSVAELMVFDDLKICIIFTIRVLDNVHIHNAHRFDHIHIRIILELFK